MTRETELAQPVIELFEGWEAWHEVSTGSVAADLVFTLGPRVAVVELKTLLSFALLEQCLWWKHWAHWVWAAAPPRKRSRNMAQIVFERFGVGVIEVGESARVVRQAEMNRRADVSYIRKALDPEGREHCLAGTGAGQRWTPWVRTCNRLQRHVAKHEGCTLRDALDTIEHHYASAPSARSSMSALLRRGVVKGLRVEKDGRALRLYSEAP